MTISQVENVYWWRQEDPIEIVRRLCERKERWSEYSTNPVSEAWIRNAIAYYSCLLEPNDWQSSLGFAGDEGELVKMMIPQARSIIRQIVSLTTKERLAFKAVAETLGSDVMNEIRLANAVSSKIVDEQQLDKKDELIVEHACIMGMGFMMPTWRTEKGQPYAVSSEGTIIYDGAIDIATPLVQDVTWDIRLPNWDQNYWVTVRFMRNRWDLIAQHPELEQAIRALPKIQENHALRAPKQDLISDMDMVYVWEAYHKPTPALPKGRMVMFSDEHTIYFDGPNLYGCLPIEPVVPEPIYGMGYGYPILSNLLPAQEMYDHSLSAIASNHSNLAVQNVMAPRNANIGVEQVRGMNFILYTPQNAQGGGKPEALNLLASSPETYKFADVLSKYMLDVSYLNSAVRGQPPAGVTSGTAIATLTANALEFLNGLSKANQICLERTMGLCVNIESKFAKTQRQVSITSKSNQAMVREYTGEDLKNVKKFKLQRVNPLMNTLGGRMDAVKDMMQLGLIKTPSDYFSILDGAPEQIVSQTETSETDLIMAENEAMLDGQEVPVLVTDDHPQHVLKHKALLNDPFVRMNSGIVKVVLDHIEEHRKWALEGDPVLMGMANTGKMPQMGPPPGGAPGPGGPPTDDMGGAPLPGEQTNEAANPATDILEGER